MSPLSSRKIECPDYQQDGPSTRCVHYRNVGMCHLKLGPDGACTEWIQVNPKLVPEGLGRSKVTQAPGQGVSGDWRASRAPTAPYSGEGVAALSQEEIERFEALGLEFLMRSTNPAVGEVWLVPEYTDDADRKEITLRDLIDLARIANYFEGTRIAGFRSLKQGDVKW